MVIESFFLGLESYLISETKLSHPISIRTRSISMYWYLWPHKRQKSSDKSLNVSGSRLINSHPRLHVGQTDFLSFSSTFSREACSIFLMGLPKLHPGSMSCIFMVATMLFFRFSAFLGVKIIYRVLVGERTICQQEPCVVKFCYYIPPAIIW